MRKHYGKPLPSKKAVSAHLAFLNLGNQDVYESMTTQRYRELSVDPHKKLTVSEINAGWFFCCEWDDMLINKCSPEAECCSCIKRNL